MIKVSSSIVFLIIFAYTLVRYTFFGDVSLSQTPLFLFNKAISFYICALLLIATLSSKNQKSWFHLAGLCTLLHVLLSLLLIPTPHFEKYLQNGVFNFSFSTSLLCGVLAVITLVLIFNLKRNFVKELSAFIGNSRSSLRLIFYNLVALHLMFLGWKGWLDMPSWHGGLAPISLLSFAVMMIVQFAFLKKNSRSGSPETCESNTDSQRSLKTE